MTPPLNTPQLPSGIIDNSIEIFANGDSVSFIQGGTVKPINLLTGKVMNNIRAEMLANQKALSILRTWHKTEPDQLQQYIACNFGGWDNVPDSDPEGTKLNRESWDCGIKQTCIGYGKVCPGSLTKTHLKVIREISTGDPEKWIADRLGMTFNTLNSHKIIIYKRLNVHSKVELLRKAIDMRLINV